MFRYGLLALGLLAIGAAEARTRVVITQPTSRSNAEIICPWTTGSVAPDWDAARQKLYLGICPPQATHR